MLKLMGKIIFTLKIFVYLNLCSYETLWGTGKNGIISGEKSQSQIFYGNKAVPFIPLGRGEILIFGLIVLDFWLPWQHKAPIDFVERSGSVNW